MNFVCVTDFFDDKNDFFSGQFYFGWFTDPVFFGEYPQKMIKRVGKRLPDFSEEEKGFLRGSTDFIGLNHYKSFNIVDACGNYAALSPYANSGILEDQDIILKADPDLEVTEMGWPVCPEVFFKLLK